MALPLTIAHAAGAPLAGSGITLSAPLARAHPGGAVRSAGQIAAPRRRVPGWLAALGESPVLAIGVAILATWTLKPGARPAPAPVARFAAPFEAGQEASTAGRFTPDGSALVYLGPRASGVGLTEYALAIVRSLAFWL